MTSAFCRKVARKLRLDPHDAGVDELADAARGLAGGDRKALLSTIEKALRRTRLDESTRQAAVKTTIALLPESEGLIERTLDARARESDYETHFTMFCFLDVVQDIPAFQVVAHRIPRLVRRYLMGVRSDAALAAWMAGDLLGDHWAGQEGLDVLREVLRKARSPVGRRAAVHGLAHRMAAAKGESRRSIGAALGEASAQDRNEAVRSYARRVLARTSTH